MADAKKKVLGWGKCTVGAHSDIVEGSTSLSVEEGQEQEALIEGGEAEGRKKAPDKYTLTYNRRVGSASEVEVGYTEDAGDITVTPEEAGAICCTLKGVSKHVAVKFDSTDGLVAIYTYKTKGKVGADGKLTDITFAAKGAA
ncbi:MAG: hypothetical protein IJ064_05485 [Bacteroidaceae bacterium]|nr:hypothetical protein [Bacteroidaceae bacterium]